MLVARPSCSVVSVLLRVCMNLCLNQGGNYTQRCAVTFGLILHKEEQRCEPLKLNVISCVLGDPRRETGQKSQESVHKPQLVKGKESENGIILRSSCFPAERLTAGPNRFTTCDCMHRYILKDCPKLWTAHGLMCQCGHPLMAACQLVA